MFAKFLNSGRDMKLFSVAILTAMSFASAENDSPTVQTNSGSIRGIYQTSYHGRKYRAFLGIPYAKPPIGKLRFQPPVPVSPWKDEIEATRKPEICIQMAMDSIDISGSENCLYLNIFAPNSLTNNSLLPVIFFIHGGGFISGSGALHGPGFLLDREVVVVTLNYRLGVMGWLSTEDDIVPGNMALKDQSTALRWVSENIEAFGGDPNKITIVGQSAGAVCAHDHSLSPWSKGLFHRGIMMSGTALNSFGVMKGALEKSQKVASLVGCSTANITIMVNCLMSMEAADIVATTSYLRGFEGTSYPFGPTVENGGHNKFLKANPIEIIKNGEAADVPWMVGVVSDEGVLFTSRYSTNETVMSEINENWNTLGPYILDFHYNIPKSNQSYVASLIKEHYFGSDAISSKTRDIYATMYGDRLFYTGIAEGAKVQAKADVSPVYFYYFNYKGAQSMMDLRRDNHDNNGVAHTDDLAYIFEVPAVNTSTTASDIAMREYMLDYWISYVTNGTPHVDVEWPPINSSTQELRYLHIKGPLNVSVEASTNFADEKFWSTINFYEEVVGMPYNQGLIVQFSVLLYIICQLFLLI